ncbi:Glutaredoxin-related protein 5, mitochondrial [Thelohanellus kitauei]|uniref:Glutaredoxin-related protein 5, mitochondrial n=1 Tax=Thelohanellus kitauei TaxID=669202 RepID=A0A0C2MM65_THEKT|nr:Glutaredoxin-related protein 5, mitochondrial [Thelohanellus kitauei]
MHPLRFNRVVPFFIRRCIKTESLVNSEHPTISEFLKSNRIVVFMKGRHDRPSCGFSKAALQILQLHGLDQVVCVDVLQDPKLMSTLKSYSEWQTFPQIYFDSKLIGGYDIIAELHKGGELVEILDEMGIQSTMKDYFKK